MPYSSISDPKLPSYVAKRSDSVRSKWISVFNHFFKMGGESKAFAMANAWLKKQLTTKTATAQSTTHIDKLFFEIDTAKGFIKQSADGTDYIDFVLTDNLPTGKVKKGYPVSLLEKWCDYINSGNMIVGDIDHKVYDDIVSKNLSVSDTISLLRSKPGIAKGLKAVVEKGRLWVRAEIDKRYTKLVRERAKAVSLEAFLIKNAQDEVVDGQLTGFTFTINDSPDNSRAVIA